MTLKASIVTGETEMIAVIFDYAVETNYVMQIDSEVLSYAVQLTQPGKAMASDYTILRGLLNSKLELSTVVTDLNKGELIKSISSVTTTRKDYLRKGDGQRKSRSPSPSPSPSRLSSEPFDDDLIVNGDDFAAAS